MGMFCVYRHANGDPSKPYLTNRAVKNNEASIVYIIEDDWEDNLNNKSLRMKDRDCNKISLYGDCGYVFSIEMTSATIKEDGGMNMGTNNLSYNKVYCDITGSYTPHAGELLTATPKCTIGLANSNSAGIANIKYNSNNYSRFFSLTGQRLSAPQKGINIVEGKKVIFR